MNESPRTVIASNRLPLSFDSASGRVVPSSGGLVTAIRGIHWQESVAWIGTTPPGLADKAGDLFEREHEGIRYIPVAVGDADYDAYYAGASNGALWPLLHYESHMVDFHWKQWDAYRRVNQQFAQCIAKVAKPNDRIWIHDYQLFLVPRYLRELAPSLRIGFFLHVPFPSSEVFRQLPVREELLDSLLHADVVGFHDYSYVRHFSTAVQILLGVECNLLAARYRGRNVQLGVFPVSIDVHRIQQAARSDEVKLQVGEHRQKRFCPHLVLGVDRLDYTKGIDLKLLAFREMLRQFPQLRGQVTLLQIAVPTRGDVPEYQKLRSTVEQLVGEINGEFGAPHYVPVQYLYESIDFTTLIALYQSAEALLVTSKRDGMNLVALEYLAAQLPDSPGTVLLSEFTGATSTLSGVVTINPWDVSKTGRALGNALLSPSSDRIRRHAVMMKYLEGYTATEWAQAFLKELARSGDAPSDRPRGDTPLDPRGPLPKTIERAMAHERLILLVDYDGTLAPICDRPEQAALPDEIRTVLHQLAKQPGVEVVVVSGRPRNYLAKEFKGCGVALAAEHGAAFLPAGGDHWESLVLSDRHSWYAVAKRIMEDYQARVPESFLEEKEHGLAWHFRLSPQDFASFQSRKLYEDLEIGLANFPVRVMAGKKVIEARAIEANKGSLALWLLSQRTATGEPVGAIAMGDDETDEDLFSALGTEAATIKVGPGPTKARYRLASQTDVAAFLRRLLDVPRPPSARP